MRRLYVDMDGVLADIVGGYQEHVGELPPLIDDEWCFDWTAATRVRLFQKLPLLPDALDLWNFCLPHRPLILTEAPNECEETAGLDKIFWGKYHFGKGTAVLITRPSEKHFYAHPGDVIVDDRPKYRHRWEAAGGVWVLHTSAAQSIHELKQLGFGK